LSVEEGLKRAIGRAQASQSAETRFENFDRDFHERIRKAFLEIARRHSDRCRVIDASTTEDDVAAAILRAVRTHFDL
jgi:dTMP kinase